MNPSLKYRQKAEGCSRVWYLSVGNPSGEYATTAWSIMRKWFKGINYQLNCYEDDAFLRDDLTLLWQMCF